MPSEIASTIAGLKPLLCTPQEAAMVSVQQFIPFASWRLCPPRLSNLGLDNDLDRAW